ncbi:MAG: DUF3105 domain-containing protein [Anaerolineae bacterium]|nr:DUF3105 domain-containing protein [Anaerolineae bacterium]
MKRSAASQKASRASNNRLWIGVVVGAGLLIVAGAAFLILNGGSQPASSIEGVVTFSVPQGHQDGPLTYPQTPPAGGIHNPAWQNCGIYDQPIPNEQAVHSLEHGAAWITYQPDLPAEDVEQLRTLVRGRDFALLSPYPDLPAPVVASAWGVQLKVDSAADPQLSAFLTRYMQGPQTPELGAPCSSGVGTPVEG